MLEHVNEMVKEIEVVLCFYILFPKKKRFIELSYDLFLHNEWDRVDAKL